MSAAHSKRFALIIEGKGDVQAAPTLITKIGIHFGSQVLISSPPIRSGEAKKLARIGELERYLLLAASRADATEIILLVDLDDGCPAQISADFQERANVISAQLKKTVHICFCVREFECWFLSTIDLIREKLPEFGIDPKATFPQAEKIRGAKEALKKICKQKVYRESRDQVLFAKSLDVGSLISRDRSFRKLVKSVTGFSYEKMESDFDLV